MERIVKFRLITYFNEVDSPVDPSQTVLTEKIGHLGEKVDIGRQADIDRLDSLGALYTEEEAAAIEDGTYDGPDREILFAARGGIRPVSQIEALEGEGAPNTMDAVALATYIVENRLNAADTVALAGETEESIQRVLDAENIASDNNPRKTVVEPLEDKLADLPE